MMQKQLRTKKKETLAKGKPKSKAKAKKAEASDPEPVEPKDPKNAKNDKKNKNKAKGKQAADGAGGSGASAASKKAAKNGKAKPPGDGEERAEDKNARKFGCPTCRYGQGGCKKCRNPNYRPRGPRKDRPATR